MFFLRHPRGFDEDVLPSSSPKVSVGDLLLLIKNTKKPPRQAEVLHFLTLKLISLLAIQYGITHIKMRLIAFTRTDTPRVRFYYTLRTRGTEGCL